MVVKRVVEIGGQKEQVAVVREPTPAVPYLRGAARGPLDRINGQKGSLRQKKVRKGLGSNRRSKAFDILMVKSVFANRSSKRAL